MLNKGKLYIIVFLILVIILLSSVFTLLALNNKMEKKSILLLYNSKDKELVKLISLDRNTFEYINEGEEYDSIVLLNRTIEKWMLDWVKFGGNMILLPGIANINDSLLQKLVRYEYRNDIVNLEKSESNSSIVKFVAWESAPSVRDRIVITGENNDEVSLETLIYAIGHEDKESFIVKMKFGKGAIFFISAILGGVVNEDFKYWPDFSYMIYVMTCEASRIKPKRFSYWEYAPIPQGILSKALIAISFLFIAISIIIFIIVREYSIRNPLNREELGAIVKMMKEKEGVSKWEEVGFHRQLTNFSIQMILSSLLLPFAIIWGIIWMRYLIKYPMVQGILDWTNNFWNVVWFIFDAGTFLAAIKYFSEYRVKDPVRAVKYIQFLAWWQIITGSIQLALVIQLVNLRFFGDDLMYFAWVFISATIAQFPGIFSVFLLVLRAMQRFDYAQYINTLVIGVVNPIISGFLALAFREFWRDIIISPVLRTAIGVFVGGYIGNWLVLGVSIYFLRRLGISVAALLRVDFDLSIVKESLEYGIKGRIGDYFVTFAWASQMILLSKFVRGYAEWQGYFSFTWGQAIIFTFLCNFIIDTLQAISEAYSLNLKNLVRLYIAEAFIFTYAIGFISTAILLASADIYVPLFYGEQWIPAITLFPYVFLFFLLSPPAWVHDQVQLGCGFPGYRSLATILEQIFRLLLFIPFLIILRAQMVGVIIAYIIALFIKDVITSLISYYKIVRFKMYFWNSIIAPGFGSLVIYFMLIFAKDIIWKNNLIGAIVGAEISGIVILFIKVALSLTAIYIGGLVYIFLLGFLHAIDKNTFRDIIKTLDTFAPIKPVAKLFGIPWLIEKGIKLSPFKRFKLDIYDEAMKEATILLEQKEKVLSSPENLHFTILD